MPPRVQEWTDERGSAGHPVAAGRGSAQPEGAQVVGQVNACCTGRDTAKSTHSSAPDNTCLAFQQQNTLHALHRVRNMSGKQKINNICICSPNRRSNPAHLLQDEGVEQLKCGAPCLCIADKQLPGACGSAAAE